MKIFDMFKKKKIGIEFSEIDSNEKALELSKKGVLESLYLMPVRFGGEQSLHNMVFVPSFVVELKDKYDDMVENLLRDGKVNGYCCEPEYKGNSFIPSKLVIVAKKDEQPIFTESIKIW